MSTSLTLMHAVNQFLAACQIDGLRPATLRWYWQMLKGMVDSLGSTPIDQVTAIHLRQYISTFQCQKSRYVGARQRPQIDGPLSDKSILGRMVAMRRFFRWCSAEYNLSLASNPMLRIRIPSEPTQAPKAIDVNDLQRLFGATDESPFGIRDRAIIAFLTDTGCRAGGILSLTLPHLNLRRRNAILLEKGNQARTVPFSPFTANLLQAWLDVRPQDATTVFCSLGGKTPGKPLQVSGLNMILKRLKDQAGITGRVNPHSFRHMVAREFLKNRGDLARLSQLLGHRDITTTVRFYARFTDDEIAEAQQQFSPIRNLQVTGKDYQSLEGAAD